MGRADDVVEQAEAAVGKAKAAPGDQAIAGAFRELLDGVREIAAEGKRGKQVPFHEAKFVTPWNPSGEVRKVKLKFPALYQNGGLCDTDKMTDEEIALANQLKPGKYFGGKWEVVKRRNKALDIRYPNGTIAARMELARDAGDLAHMLKKILVEQESRIERKKRGQFEEEDDDYSTT